MVSGPNDLADRNSIRQVAVLLSLDWRSNWCAFGKSAGELIRGCCFRSSVRVIRLNDRAAIRTNIISTPLRIFVVILEILATSFSKYCD